MYINYIAIKNSKKSTINYHLISIKIAVIKETRGKKYSWRHGEKGSLVHCWWECKLMKPLWKTVWSFLKKLKIELPYDPAIPIQGIYPNRIIIWKDTYPCPPFIAALFTIAKTWEKTQVSINRWIDKEDVVHIYIQWNTTQPFQEWKNAICKDMDGPRHYHTKWSKSEIERQIPYDITICGN